MYSYSQIMDLPVNTLKGGDELGKVAGLVVDPEPKDVRWLSVDSSGRLHGRHWVSTDHVYLLTPEGVTITDEQEVKQPKEALAAEQIVRDGRTLIGHLVVLSNGQVLGQVKDLHFDSATWKLVDLILHAQGDSSGSSLIIPAAQIEAIRPDVITIKPGSSPAWGTTPVPAAAARPRRRLRSTLATLWTTLMLFHR